MQLLTGQDLYRRIKMETFSCGHSYICNEDGYKYYDYCLICKIKQLEERAAKVIDLIGGPMDQKNLDILWGAIDELKKVLEKYKL